MKKKRRSQTNPYLVIGVVLIMIWTGDSSGSQAKVRPSLLISPADIPRLRQRLSQQPYKAVFQNYQALLADSDAIDSSVQMQLAAQFFTLTGDKTYAQRAQDVLMKSWIDDWQARIPKYTGSDYRSLGVSRALQKLCVVYDLIQPAGLLTAAEEKRVENVLALAAARLMERHKGFNPYDYYLTRFRVDNWNSDRFVAVGLFALTFPNHASSDIFLQHAVDEFIWQMDNALLPNGAWTEGTRYQGAILRAFLPFVHALKRHNGKDLFANVRFKALLESLMHLQTPRDATLNQVALLPGVGDSNWESIWEAALAWGASGYTDTEPEFAGRLMWAWRRAGSPFALEFSGGNVAAGLLLIDDTIKSVVPQPLTSEQLPGSFIVLRHGWETDAESCLFFNTGTQRGAWQHQHDDRGSISLYAWNTPLALDAGVNDYGEDLAAWYMRGKAHNRVTFEGSDSKEKAIWSEIVPVAQVETCLFTESLDCVVADLSSMVENRYQRWIFFSKPDYYLIWDQIKSAEPAQYNFHVLTEANRSVKKIGVDSEGTDRYVFPCQNNIHLKMWLLSPLNPSQQELLTWDQDPHPIRFYTERNSQPAKTSQRTPLWLKLNQATTGEDFLTLLYPGKKNSAPLQLRRFARRVQFAAAVSGSFLVESFLLQTNLDKTDLTFYLGAQDQGQDHFQGKAAVLRRDDRSLTNIHLIDGRLLQIGEGLVIALNHPTTLTLQSVRSGFEYQLENHGTTPNRIELRLPWLGPLRNLVVFAGASQTEIAMKRHQGKNLISFPLKEEVYRLVVNQ